MATIVHSNLFQFNDKLNVENNLYNKIDYKNNDFVNNIDFLLEDMKREYQDIYLDNPKTDRELANLSSKEKSFYLNEQYVKNYINQQKTLNEISHTSRTLAALQSNNGSSTDSLNDLFDDVKQSITAGKNDYLDVLKDIFSKYMDFVRELREILSELGKGTSAADKDGSININIDNLLNKLNLLKMKAERNDFFSIWMYFNKDDDGQYYRMINGEKVYYKNNIESDNAIKAVEKLLSQIKGVTLKKEDNSASVKPNLSFLFNVSLDLSGLDKLIDYLGKMPAGDHSILQTEFDLLKKTLDSIEKGVNANLDELSKKYSSANSNYDNFVKIVSSTMNTLLEMAKGFLRF